MTDAEKVLLLKQMAGGTDTEETLYAYLSLAGSAILRHAYPFGGGPDEVPAEYAARQVEIAAYMLNKRGAEGQTAHGENGISRSYGSAYIPPEMLKDVIPHAVTGGSKNANAATQ